MLIVSFLILSSITVTNAASVSKKLNAYRYFNVVINAEHCLDQKEVRGRHLIASSLTRESLFQLLRTTRVEELKRRVKRSAFKEQGVTTPTTTQSTGETTTRLETTTESVDAALEWPLKTYIPSPVDKKAETKLPKAPNVAYICRGYHFFEGHPEARDIGGDPGYRNLIFVYSNFSSKTVSSDFKHQVPNGIRVYNKDMCSFYNVAKEYQASSSKDTMVDVSTQCNVQVLKMNWVPFGFAERKQPKLWFEHSNAIRRHRRFICVQRNNHGSKVQNGRIRQPLLSVRYDLWRLWSPDEPLRITWFHSGVLSTDVMINITVFCRFINAIKSLEGKSETDEAWKDFFNEYGTHYILQLTMGSKNNKVVSYQRSALEESSESFVANENNVEVNLLVVSVSVKKRVTTSKKTARRCDKDFCFPLIHFVLVLNKPKCPSTRCQ